MAMFNAIVVLTGIAVMSDDERVRMEDNDDGTQRLIIANARKDDQDEYRCLASNDYGDVWSDVTLTVSTPAPRIVKELTAVTAVEKETATMECVVGNREDDVKWFKDGAQLVPDERHKLEELDEGRRRQIIDTVRLEDQANYRVEVSNECGSANSKAPLTVKPLDELKLKKPLDDVSTTERMRIQLQVEVIGKPKTVRWYRQDAEIATDARVKYERVSDEQHRLIIEEARVEDAGKYRVVLSTESLQSVESSCQVTVTHKLPTFKKGLKDETIKKGDKLQLQGEIEGTAKTVKWYKDGKEVEECRGKTTVQVEDGGVYAVVAANEAGEMTPRKETPIATRQAVINMRENGMRGTEIAMAGNGFGGFNKRAFDSLSSGNFGGFNKRAFDSLSGSGFGGFNKRAFDSLSSGNFGGFNKRAFDSLGDSGFGGFNKRAFDSLSSGNFGGFNKRAFDSLSGSGFGGFNKRAFDSLSTSGFDGFEKRLSSSNYDNYKE